MARSVLHVREHGPADAQPIVFLHGVGNSGAMWDGHAAALIPQTRSMSFSGRGA